MDLAAVITRIRAQCASFTNRVAGSAELALASRETESITKPSAWVIPDTERATENRVDFGSYDRIEESFRVVVALDNTGDYRGQASSIAVEAIRDELRAGLVGWAVDSDHLPTQYDAGDLADIDRSALWYEFRFVSVKQSGIFIRYQIDTLLGFTTTSLSSVLSTLVSNIATTTGGTRLTSDYSESLQVIAQGTTRFQIRSTPLLWVAESNTNGTQLAVELVVIRHLDTGEAERDYTEGDMHTDIEAMSAPSYWRVADDVEVLEDPTLPSMAERL